MPIRSWWRWTAAALVVGMASAGAATWVRGRQLEREQAEGFRIAREAAALGRQAREADSRSRHAEATLLLDRGVRLLRGARGVHGDPFAALLVDLASLRLVPDPRDAASRSSARALLEEARGVPGVGSALRARVDRDLGTLCLLEGDLRAAECWYTEAQQLDPSDPQASERLRLLRETRPSRSSEGP